MPVQRVWYIDTKRNVSKKRGIYGVDKYLSLSFQNKYTLNNKADIKAEGLRRWIWNFT